MPGPWDRAFDPEQFYNFLHELEKGGASLPPVAFDDLGDTRERITGQILGWTDRPVFWDDALDLTTTPLVNEPPEIKAEHAFWRDIHGGSRYRPDIYIPTDQFLPSLGPGNVVEETGEVLGHLDDTPFRGIPKLTSWAQHIVDPAIDGANAASEAGMWIAQLMMMLSQQGLGPNVPGISGKRA